MGAISDDLREWMEKGVRPLEMQVAAEFLKSTPTVEQSPFYSDPDSGIPREIDVVALYPGRERQYVVSVEVECKAKAEPFIVLLSSKNVRVGFRCMSRHARAVQPDLRRDVVGIDLYGTALFDPSIPIGYGILTKGKSTNDKSTNDRTDKGWAAAMAAAKAAQWFATRLDETEHTESHMAFPVVVTDAVLATAQLVGTQIEVAEVDHARFVLKWTTGRCHGRHCGRCSSRSPSEICEGCCPGSPPAPGAHARCFGRRLSVGDLIDRRTRPTFGRVWSRRDHREASAMDRPVSPRVRPGPIRTIVRRPPKYPDQAV